jgi:hypothetical protein
MEQNKNTPPENRKILPFYSVRMLDLIAPRAQLTAKCGFCGREADLDVIKIAAGAECPATLFSA